MFYGHPIVRVLNDDLIPVKNLMIHNKHTKFDYFVNDPFANLIYFMTILKTCYD